MSSPRPSSRLRIQWHSRHLFRKGLTLLRPSKSGGFPDPALLGSDFVFLVLWSFRSRERCVLPCFDMMKSVWAFAAWSRCRHRVLRQGTLHQPQQGARGGPALLPDHDREPPAGSGAGPAGLPALVGGAERAPRHLPDLRRADRAPGHRGAAADEALGKGGGQAGSLRRSRAGRRERVEAEASALCVGGSCRKDFQIHASVQGLVKPPGPPALARPGKCRVFRMSVAWRAACCGVWRFLQRCPPASSPARALWRPGPRAPRPCAGFRAR